MSRVNRGIFIVFILAIFTLPMINIGCNDPYKGIDYTRFQREEAELLAEYYDYDSDLDSLVNQVAIRVVDNREASGLYFMEFQSGVGDTIANGQYATFRYNYYELIRDAETDKPTLFGPSSNYGAAEPDRILVGSETWFQGLHEGIRYMQIGSKARMIIPSTIGTKNDFITIVMDVEITSAEF